MYNFNYKNGTQNLKDNLEIGLSLKEIKEVVSKEDFELNLKIFKTDNYQKYTDDGYNKFVDLFIENFHKLSLEEKSKIIQKVLKKEKEFFLKEEMSNMFKNIKHKIYVEQKKDILNKMKELDSLQVPSLEKIKDILSEYNLKDYNNLFFDTKSIFIFYK